MMLLIGQIVGCLAIAAGIGAAVGWLLQQLATGPVREQLMETEAALRAKEKALDRVQYELKAKLSTIQIMEQKTSTAEAAAQAAQQTVSVHEQQIQQVKAALTATMERTEFLEVERTTLLEKLSLADREIAAVTLGREDGDLRFSHLQQELAERVQACEELSRRVVELEGGLGEVELLRAQVTELAPAQGRLHWMEVQLSEKETQHRAAMHALEEIVRSRDEQIRGFAQLQQELDERTDVLRGLEGRITQLQAQLKDHDQQALVQAEQIQLLESQAQDARRLLREKDEALHASDARLAELEAKQRELDGQTHILTRKDEELARLRKRLGEIRAALRSRGDGSPVSARTTQHANQLTLQIGSPKPPATSRKDDLKKIPGIGPVIERTLNRLGTYTYLQIAKWTPMDIARVSKKLTNFPDRIKRDNWIAAAKKHHREKYGDRP